MFQYTRQKSKECDCSCGRETKRTVEIKSISVTFDNRDNFKPGYKFNEYEIKGVLCVLESDRDLENKQVELARRDTLEKQPAFDRVVDHIPFALGRNTEPVVPTCSNFRKSHTTIVDDFSSFNEVLFKKGLYPHIGTEQLRPKKQ